MATQYHVEYPIAYHIKNSHKYIETDSLSVYHALFITFCKRITTNNTKPNTTTKISLKTETQIHYYSCFSNLLPYLHDNLTQPVCHG